MINNYGVKCYTAEDGSRYVSKDIERFLRANADVNIVMLFDPMTLKKTPAYEVENAIVNLKAAPLKYFAKIGLEYLIDNNPIMGSKMPEPMLSEFDKVIKRALKFNPNKGK